MAVWQVHLSPRREVMNGKDRPWLRASHRPGRGEAAPGADAVATVPRCARPVAGRRSRPGVGGAADTSLGAAPLEGVSCETTGRGIAAPLLSVGYGLAASTVGRAGGGPWVPAGPFPLEGARCVAQTPPTDDVTSAPIGRGA